MILYRFVPKLMAHIGDLDSKYNNGLQIKIDQNTDHSIDPYVIFNASFTWISRYNFRDNTPGLPDGILSDQNS
jgi:hypothetical protein